MTDNEIRIKIAEALGWTSIKSECCPSGMILFGHTPGTAHNETRIELHPVTMILGRKPKSVVPDYPNSLDACAEMEQTLSDSERMVYEHELRHWVLGNKANHYASAPWEMITATARQRCEAFLRVKGLWQDEPINTKGK